MISSHLAFSVGSRSGRCWPASERYLANSKCLLGICKCTLCYQYHYGCCGETLSQIYIGCFLITYTTGSCKSGITSPQHHRQWGGSNTDRLHHSCMAQYNSIQQAYKQLEFMPQRNVIITRTRGIGYVTTVQWASLPSKNSICGIKAKTPVSMITLQCLTQQGCLAHGLHSALGPVKFLHHTNQLRYSSYTVLLYDRLLKMGH